MRFSKLLPLIPWLNFSKQNNITQAILVGGINLWFDMAE
jgi:hypothetical protein